MVLPAAETNRKFVGCAQARRGFACIENDGVCVCDRIDKPSRERGDAGHAAQKVESNALACEECSCRSVEVSQHGASCSSGAIFCFCDKRYALIESEEDMLRNV